MGRWSNWGCCVRIQDGQTRIGRGTMKKFRCAQWIDTWAENKFRVHCVDDNRHDNLMKLMRWSHASTSSFRNFYFLRSSNSRLVFNLLISGQKHKLMNEHRPMVRRRMNMNFERMRQIDQYSSSMFKPNKIRSSLYVSQRPNCSNIGFPRISSLPSPGESIVTESSSIAMHVPLSDRVILS